MKDFLKKLYRPLLYLVISVYVLSIPIQGQTLYSHSRKVLVDNRVVGLIIEHCSAIYQQLSDRIRLSLVDTAAPKEKSTN